MIFGRFLERLGCTYVAVGEGDEATAELELTGQLPPLGIAGGAGLPTLPAPFAKQPSAGDPTSQAPTPRRRRPFDCVFLDIVMCRTDGAQTCRELRRRGLRLPVIAATGNRSCRQYFEAGFDHVMEKPFTQTVLLAVLREHVLAPQAAAAAAQAAAVLPGSAVPAEASPVGLTASSASAPAPVLPGSVARDASAPAASVPLRGTLAASAAAHSTSASAPEISESALGAVLDDKPSSAAPPDS
jgi:CheY-like chemotaxis protein